MLLATFNPGKIKEYRLLLKELPLKLVSLKSLGIKEEFEEKGKTLEENAKEKAKFYSKLSNLPAIADDSGLEIDILKGEPGAKSRRWLGYEAGDRGLIDFTLKKLKGIPWQKRKAQLRTILALAIPNGERTSVFIFEGKIRGVIAREPKGRLIAGYPFRLIFYLPKFKKTFAELGLKKEIEIGHRKKAVKKMIPVLRSKLLRVQWTVFDSPIEKIFIARDEDCVCKISLSKKEFFKEIKNNFLEITENKKKFKNVLLKLAGHFKKLKVNFDFELDLSNLTPFEQKVLQEVKKIPRGKTKTYQEIARAISKPKASRAVGMTISKNPFPIIIPCHRVLGKKEIGNYIFGRKIKKYLLELEKY